MVAARVDPTGDSPLHVDRAEQNMRQLYCHTKPPTASRCATVHPDEYPVAIARSQTTKRFAQALIDLTEKNVPPIQVGNWQIVCKSRRSASSRQATRRLTPQLSRLLAY